MPLTKLAGDFIQLARSPFLLDTSILAQNRHRDLPPTSSERHGNVEKRPVCGKFRDGLASRVDQCRWASSALPNGKARPMRACRRCNVTSNGLRGL